MLLLFPSRYLLKSVPWQLKIGFSGLLALIINPPSAPTSSDNLIPWAGLLCKEMLIGFLLAFLCFASFWYYLFYWSID